MNKISVFKEMLKILVMDGPIMSAESFKILAGKLSVPVDLDSLRLRISEIISSVLISINLNVDSSVGDKLFVDCSSGKSSISNTI